MSAICNLKGIGRIYQQQIFIDFAKLSNRKTPITAADLLNDRVMPFFEEHDIKLLRVLTDRGSEFRGNSNGTNTTSSIVSLPQKNVSFNRRAAGRSARMDQRRQ
jgi:hypothetical protein